jgi:hypothetical protein
MHALMSRPIPHRWTGRIVLTALALSLCVVLLPDVTDWLATRDDGAADSARLQAAALSTIRTGFLHARIAEQDVLSGTPSSAHDSAMTAVRQALGAMRGDAWATGALREAVDRYDAAVRSVAVPNTRSDADLSDTIEATLGQLAAADEAVLNEPLQKIRLAETELLSGADPRAIDQLAQSADGFLARLARLPIAEGTRTRLAAKLAVSVHDISGTTDAVLAIQQSQTKLRDAALSVEAAIDEVGRTLAREQASGTTMVRTWRTLGMALLVLLALTAGGGFGFGRTVINPGTRFSGELH